MNQQLQKYSPDLSQKSIEIFNVLESQLIKNMSDQDVKQILIKDMLASYFQCGFTYPTDSDFQLMVSAVLQNIRQEGMGLRINEISIAFSRGVLKEYGEFMGLSVVSFTQFLKGYVMNNARLDALKEFHKPKDQKPDPTDKEIFNLSKMNAIQAFLDINAGKSIILGSVVYDFIDAQGLINFTKDEKLDFYERAKRAILDEKKTEKDLSNDSFKRNDIRKVIESITDGTEKDIVIAKAKQIALVKFMIDFKEKGKDIAEYLNYKAG